MGLSGLPEELGRGLMAGMVGTAAMTLSSTLEAKVRNRGSSSAPADAARKVLGIEKFSSDADEQRFNQLVHVGYGTGWGAVRGVLSALGLGPTAATAGHFGAVWGTELVALPALEVSPPATEWGGKEIAIDVLHHGVYALTTAAAFEWLRNRSAVR